MKSLTCPYRFLPIPFFSPLYYDCVSAEEAFKNEKEEKKIGFHSVGQIQSSQPVDPVRVLSAGMWRMASFLESAEQCGRWVNDPEG